MLCAIAEASATHRHTTTDTATASHTVVEKEACPLTHTFCAIEGRGILKLGLSNRANG